jgi:chemotaxis protein CheX
MSVNDLKAATSPSGTLGRSTRVQLINCYVSAAADVLWKETGQTVKRGGLQLQQDPYTSEDVTAMIGVSGDLAGSFYLSMSLSTALALVSIMLGQPTTNFDELAQSGIAELANVVAGAAGVALAEVGRATNITPPLLLVGAGARLSSVEIQRLVVPLETSAGLLHIHVALRDSGS